MFGALALVQLRTLHVTQIWMYAVPLVPMGFGIYLVFRDIQAWRKKRAEDRNSRNLEEGRDD